MRALYQWDLLERFFKENSFGELVIIQIPIHKAFDLVNLCIVIILSAGLLRVAVVQRPELETNRSSQKIRYASSFSTSRSI